MSHPSPPSTRCHLRLAGPAVERRRVTESRAVLLARGAAGAVALVLLTLFAWALAALALLPLLLRRAPMGVRLRPLRQREARIIPFQRARQKALPR